MFGTVAILKPLILDISIFLALELLGLSLECVNKGPSENREQKRNQQKGNQKEEKSGNQQKKQA